MNHKTKLCFFHFLDVFLSFLVSLLFGYGFFSFFSRLQSAKSKKVFEDAAIQSFKNTLNEVLIKIGKNPLSKEDQGFLDLCRIFIRNSDIISLKKTIIDFLNSRNK